MFFVPFFQAYKFYCNKTNLSGIILIEINEQYCQKLSTTIDRQNKTTKKHLNNWLLRDTR